MRYLEKTFSILKCLGQGFLYQGFIRLNHFFLWTISFSKYRKYTERYDECRKKCNWRV